MSDVTTEIPVLTLPVKDPAALSWEQRIDLRTSAAETYRTLHPDYEGGVGVDVVESGD